jgi:hypothetical protein
VPEVLEEFAGFELFAYNNEEMYKLNPPEYG